MSHYCIIKNVKTVDGKELPVIMLDAFDEVWEFNSSEEAEKIAGNLTKNSDSGYTYYVRKV
jgi:exo-beta-1,3-glucanase (GH17 family)